MKAILLAAGVGSRIAGNIGQKPKSLLDVNGEPLIVHTVDLLQKNHIEVIVVTGFQHCMIEETLKERHVKIYYNPFFRVTNSIGSLWYARDEFHAHEMMIANADVYYTQELLDKAFSTKYDNCLLCDETRADTGDYFFLSEHDVLKKYGKNLKREDRNSEYVGIGVLRNEWVYKFQAQLCALVENGLYDFWWENVLYSMVGKETIYTMDVEGIFWSEVDTIQDYQRVLNYCAKSSHPDQI